MESQSSAKEPEYWFPAKCYWLEMGPTYQFEGMGGSGLVADRILFWSRLSNSASQLASRRVRRRHGRSARAHLLLERRTAPLALGKVTCPNPTILLATSAARFVNWAVVEGTRTRFARRGCLNF